MKLYEQAKKVRGEGGFTLLEALISIVILSVGLLGIAGLQGNAIRTNATSQEVTAATNWAGVRIDQLIHADYSQLVDQQRDDDQSPYYRDQGLTAVGANADGSDTYGDRYNLFFNVAEDYPYFGTKTVNVIIRWVERGKQKQSEFRFIKSNI
jgi:type II secretory pathway pseudopilin PulG